MVFGVLRQLQTILYLLSRFFIGWFPSEAVFEHPTCCFFGGAVGANLKKKKKHGTLRNIPWSLIKTPMFVFFLQCSNKRQWEFQSHPIEVARIVVAPKVVKKGDIISCRFGREVVKSSVWFRQTKQKLSRWIKPITLLRATGLSISKANG